MVQPTRLLCKKRVKGLIKEMKLRPYVATSGRTLGRATCLQEMTVLMTCWKEHEFQDNACDSQIQAFIACTQQVAEDKAQVIDSSTTGSQFSVDVINSVLRRYDKQSQRR